MNLRVCLAQINSTVGDLDGNKHKITEALAKARHTEADLVVFPELTITGYPPEDLLFNKGFILKNRRTLTSIAPLTRGLLAVVGFVDMGRDGRLFNAAGIFANGRLLAKYRKVELPNYGVFDEKRYFAPGTRPMILRLGKYSLGFSICEDIWQPESFVYRSDYFRHISALINISASPYHRGKHKEREGLLRRLARRLGVPVIYQNLVGGQDELVFDGGSMIMGTDGRVLGGTTAFEEQIAVFDIALRAPAAQGKAPSADRVNAAWPLKTRTRPRIAAPKQSPQPPAEEEVYKALVLGTHDYIRKNGFKKVLIGLSGGIDSALVACIAVDALGRENVVGVTMPSIYTSSATYEDAKRLARNLGISCLEFDIGRIFSAYLSGLKKAFSGHAKNSAEENLQARVRGNILMALSNKFGHLVLTTGNKSEMATGYCTLYGDMAGGFAVIKDVPKTLVYRLARYRNHELPGGMIPSSTLLREPTAELRRHQKDRDTLPPYPVLDRFLEAYVERDMPLDRIIRRGASKKLALRIARMVDGNEYKRRQAPPGVKITPKAFGRDRRMPITNRYSS